MARERLRGMLRVLRHAQYPFVAKTWHAYRVRGLQQGASRWEIQSCLHTPLHVAPRCATSSRARITGQPWAMVTAYDALTAGIFDRPAFLRYSSAIPQRWSSTATTRRSRSRSMRCCRWCPPWSAAPGEALVIADLPFGSYQGPGQALATATRFMKDAGAHAVKLEGGLSVLPQVEALASAGIPVIGHLGLTPQSVNLLGGYRVQGRGESGEILMRDAKALEAAGATAVVLEVVPEELAARVSEVLTIPTIGIGAGSGTDAQVIVWQDLLGPHPRSGPAIRESLCEPAGRDDASGRAVGRATCKIARIRPLNTLTVTDSAGPVGTPLNVGDANPGMGLVAPVHRDQVRGPRLYLASVS